MRDVLMPALLGAIGFGLFMLIVERVPWLHRLFGVVWPW